MPIVTEYADCLRLEHLEGTVSKWRREQLKELHDTRTNKHIVRGRCFVQPPLALGLTSLGARTAYRTEAFSFQSRPFTLHFLYVRLFRIGERVLSVLHLTLIQKLSTCLLPSPLPLTLFP